MIKVSDKTFTQSKPAIVFENVPIVTEEDIELVNEIEVRELKLKEIRKQINELNKQGMSLEIEIIKLIANSKIANKPNKQRELLFKTFNIN